jgi:hypothetical protein
MKHNYHVFTAMAFDAVHEALENTEVAKTATMYAGTMFVECNAYSASKIETALIKKLKCGVIVSKVGREYSFDFVGA